MEDFTSINDVIIICGELQLLLRFQPNSASIYQPAEKASRLCPFLCLVVLLISAGAVNCAFHVGFPAEGWHCFPCTEQPQQLFGKEELSALVLFWAFPFSPAPACCHNGSGILCVVNPGSRSNISLLKGHHCGTAREPQSRGLCLMHSRALSCL